MPSKNNVLGIFVIWIHLLVSAQTLGYLQTSVPGGAPIAGEQIRVGLLM